MSVFTDLLAVSQEEAVMRNVAKQMAVDYETLHPKYFTFTYNSVDDATVSVQINSRPVASTGEVCIWQGNKTIQIKRANMVAGLSPRSRTLRVNWVDGMAMEHVIRALKVLYNFNVTLAELEFQDPVSLDWSQFSDSYRPPVPASGYLSYRVRFVQNQARFVPSTSLFTVLLEITDRADLGEYLRLIAAGSIAGGIS